MKEMDSAKPHLSPSEEARAYGIDISLIEDNLERTPTERILIHQAALETVIALQEAMQNAQSSQHSSTTDTKQR